MQAFRGFLVQVGCLGWHLLTLAGHSYRIAAQDRLIALLDHRRGKDIEYSIRVLTQTVNSAKRLEELLADSLTTLQTVEGQQVAFDTFAQGLVHLRKQGQSYLMENATAEEVLKTVSAAQPND